MPYYPSSQVKTNLYTTGDKYRVFNGSMYVGDYYINSRGEAYTGKTPQAPNTNKLYLANTAPNENPVYLANADRQSTKNGQYSFYVIDYPYFQAKRRNFNTSETAPLKPIQELNVPVEDDYTIGEFQRYFLKKNNEIEFIEVNYKQYQMFKNKNSKVQWEMYSPCTINWVLTGKEKDVYNLNKNIVMLYETRNKLLGFVNSFNKRFSKFYKKEVDPIVDTTETSSIQEINAPSTRIGGYQ